MQDALHKAYISYKTTHGPQSLDYSCQEGLKGSESQKAGGELHFVLNLKRANPHVGFVFFFFFFFLALNSLE